jgi:hypothetical protein
MNCEDVARLLDGYIDADLAPPTAGVVEEHLERCAACRAQLDEQRTLRQLLAGLPAPSPRPGVLERMLKTAVAAPAPAARAWQRPIWFRAGLAAAAVVLLAVGFTLGMHMAGLKAPGVEIVATAQPVQLGPTVQRVALMFRASDSLPDASISVSLPDGVQIAGRPNVRYLSWRTDLKPGANLLELPLLATGTQTGPHSGTLVVRLSQGSLVRRLEVPIALQPKNPRATAQPVRDARVLS